MKKILIILGICLVTFSSCCDHQYVLDGKRSGLWEEYHCIKCADSYRLWLDDFSTVECKGGVPIFNTYKKGQKTEKMSISIFD